MCSLATPTAARYQWARPAAACLLTARHATCAARPPGRPSCMPLFCCARLEQVCSAITSCTGRRCRAEGRSRCRLLECSGMLPVAGAAAQPASWRWGSCLTGSGGCWGLGVGGRGGHNAGALATLGCGPRAWQCVVTAWQQLLASSTALATAALVSLPKSGFRQRCHPPGPGAREAVSLATLPRSPAYTSRSLVSRAVEVDERGYSVATRVCSRRMARAGQQRALRCRWGPGCRLRTHAGGLGGQGGRLARHPARCGGSAGGSLLQRAGRAGAPGRRRRRCAARPPGCCRGRCGLGLAGSPAAHQQLERVLERRLLHRSGRWAGAAPTGGPAPAAAIGALLRQARARRSGRRAQCQARSGWARRELLLCF